MSVIEFPLSTNRAVPLKAGMQTSDTLNFDTVRFPNWSVTDWSAIVGVGHRTL